MEAPFTSKGGGRTGACWFEEGELEAKDILKNRVNKQCQPGLVGDTQIDYIYSPWRVDEAQKEIVRVRPKNESA